MANGIASLRGYQQGGGPIAIGHWRSSLARGLRRLMPLFFGERSEMPSDIPESIYNAVTPWASSAVSPDVLLQLIDAMGRIARGDPGDPRAAYSPPIMGDDLRLGGTSYQNRKRAMGSRPTDEEDAWREFLGLPQQHGTFKEAEFRPTIGSGEDISYMEFADPKRVWDEILSHPYMDYREVSKPEFPGLEDIDIDSSTARWQPNAIQNLLKKLEDNEPSLGSINRLNPTLSGYSDPRHRYSDVLGTYRVGRGEDERGPYISYYDKYNLKHLPSRITKVGQPFDIYGRMYYDPETYEYLSGIR